MPGRDSGSTPLRLTNDAETCSRGTPRDEVLRPHNLTPHLGAREFYSSLLPTLRLSYVGLPACVSPML